MTDSLNRVMASLKLAIHKVGVKKGEIFEEAVKAKEFTEKKQEDILDSINGWAWETDSKGVITFCSKNVSSILGFKQKDLIGKNIFDLMLPEDAKKNKPIFIETIKEKKPIKNFENWFIKNNNERIYVVTNGVPFFDENNNLLSFRGVNTEITNEKIANDKINSLNRELTDLRMQITELLNNREKDKGLKGYEPSIEKLDEKWSEHEFDSVFIFDEKANIIDCNENMHKRLGYSKSEMLSLNMSDFDALETKNDLADKINTAKKNGTFSFKTIHKRKDGSAVLVFENLQYNKDKNIFKCIVRDDYSLKKTQR